MLDKVNKYYTDTIRKHGASAKGVDWKDEASQNLRFDMLMKVVDWSSPPSINDFGCGYGALVDYLESRNLKVKNYVGYDISAAMISEAWARHARYIFVESNAPVFTADYTVASGTFNVILDTDRTEWRVYVGKTLLSMWQKSNKGMAFNCMTTKVDYEVEHLYYADPEEYVRLCELLGDVELLEDYGLYEWTILVRRRNK